VMICIRRAMDGNNDFVSWSWSTGSSTMVHEP
jgi:hypothetical protein